MPLSPLELQTLLRRVARGDAAAFSQLYEATSAKLFGVVLRIVNQREVAEETLQECYVAVWERAADFDPMRGPALGWLVAIARNSAIDRLRRQASRPEGRRAPEEMLLTMPAGERTERSAEWRDLQRCLGELDEQPRRAVMLAHLYGLTRDELAVKLAVPVGTVKSWIRRSLERLKACLDS